MSTTAPAPATMPVAILTRNRAVLLDATLRSLSAAGLPDGTPVTVYDDASDDPQARRYLNGTGTIETDHRWPTHPAWLHAGLAILHDRPTLRGIADRVGVTRLAPQPIGVGNASARIAGEQLRWHPDARAVLILQDDVLLNPDAFARMTEAVDRAGEDVALVAGCHLDHRYRPHRPAERPDLLSAQCLAIMRPFHAAHRKWFHREHARKNWDRALCDHARRHGYELHLLDPYCAQHIGVKSTVRPGVEFFSTTNSQARLCRRARPPYALADDVASFLSSAR